MVTIAPEMMLSQLYHRHEWTVSVNQETPYSYVTDADIVARCECGAEMDKAQIERVLNAERFLTDG